MYPNEVKDITAHLAYSNKISELARSHQHEVTQLLDDMHQLQSDLRALSDALHDAEQVIADKDRQLDMLQAELDALRSTRTKLFCRITQVAYERGKAQEVENALQSAAYGSATKLMEAIRLYETIDYLDTKNLSTTELYDLLKGHFGLKYNLRNFTTARNKS